MELEFDNEIDALLRKARDDRGVLVGDTAKLHLDADEISAFAENAVPDSAKRAYMAHFADCDGCRKTLSGVILLNSEAAVETATAVAVRLSGDALEINAPLGRDDLFGLLLRPTPCFSSARRAIFDQRIADKKWLTRYPRVRIADSSADQNLKTVPR